MSDHVTAILQGMFGGWWQEWTMFVLILLLAISLYLSPAFVGWIGRGLIAVALGVMVFHSTLVHQFWNYLEGGTNGEVRSTIDAGDAETAGDGADEEDESTR